MGTQGIENEVNTGVIENFLQQLPEQIFHLGLGLFWQHWHSLSAYS